jgi:hypothetical protein
MKKTLLIIGICAVLISMPALTAFEISEKPTNIPKFEAPPVTKPLADYDGTFVGGMGNVYKDENDEWVFDTHAYIAGVYKGGKYKRVVGNIYNLDEEQIGTFGFISGKWLLIGRVVNMEEEKAPIIGFIFYNDQYFIGRIMSFFGPAPHIYGEYTPN